MGCNLQKLETYGLGRVTHNTDTNETIAQLSNPPSSCPDRAFASKKAEIRIIEGTTPVLTYDQAKAKAVVIVPSKNYVEYIPVSSGPGFFFYTAVILALIAISYFIKKAFTKAAAESDYAPNRENTQFKSWNRDSIDPDAAQERWEMREKNRQNNEVYRASQKRSYTPPTGGFVPPRAPAEPSVIVHQSNNDLLTGVMLGQMMSDNHNHHTHTERVIEREAPSSFSSDSSPSHKSDSSSSYSSSDDDSSRRSSSYDSSSSYSSDSSSSFSSDSGSSFSSDSGSSFGSD